MLNLMRSRKGLFEEGSQFGLHPLLARNLFELHCVFGQSASPFIEVLVELPNRAPNVDEQVQVDNKGCDLDTISV